VPRGSGIPRRRRRRWSRGSGPYRWEHIVIQAPDPRFNIDGWQQASPGDARVWATENTREAIFDAMKHKKTYATTGPRMVVRFFGGRDCTADDAQSRLPAGVGCAKGVPMGGDLRKAPASKAPSFLVTALKDPCSGNLDRIQVVEGWLEKVGRTHEKVYDVARSGARQSGSNGRLPPVGNTVDVAKAIWQYTIGAPELSTAWTDPEFDAQQPASITRASSRFPRHAGPRTRRCVSASRCRPKCR